MTVDGLAALSTAQAADAPWWQPYRRAAAVVLDAVRAGRSVVDALNHQVPEGLPRFVPATQLPAGEPYESFIARTRCVPTRGNPHDLFNGLVWRVHPALKWRLNALHAQAIARDGIGPERGPQRDALTLFDESGAVLAADPMLWAALRARDWSALFVDRRGLWAGATLVIVGHALLEKLAVSPRKALTAHVVDGDPLALGATGWAAKPLCPLPVFGTPGWHAGNEDPAFYGDTRVFRR